MKRRSGSGWKQYLLSLAMAAVVVLFFQYRALDVEQHNQRIELLLHLSATESELDRLVLLTSFFHLNHYDPFVTEVQRLRKLSQQAQAAAGTLNGELGDSFREDLKRWLDALQEKLQLLEQIKSKTGLVRNGLHYLPLAVAEMGAVDPAAGTLLAGLLNELFYSNLFPTSLNLQQLQAQLQRIKQPSQLTQEGASRFVNSLFHMQANLRLVGELAKLRDDYRAVPSRSHFDQLYSRYTATFASLGQQSDLYSRALLGITLLLFLALGVALRRSVLLRGEAEQAWAQLHDAVESLSEGFALFDRQERLVLHNRCYLEFYPWLAGITPGKTTLTEIVCRNASSGHLHLSGFHEEGLDLPAIHLAPGEVHTYLEQYDNDRWYLASDSGTSTGGIACVRVDISDSKRIEQERRKLYRALEQSPASVVITDTDGTIEYVNPKFEEVTGYRASEILGQNPRILKSGDKSSFEYQELWETISAGKVWRGQFHNRRKDGGIYWESASISPVRDQSGVITHYIAVKEDITSQKRAEDQLRLNATVFETTNEGIVVTDADNRIVSVNPAFTRITGYLAEEAIGREPSFLSSGRHDQAFYRTMWLQLYARGYWRGEVWNRRKDGQVYPEWLSIVQIRDEKGAIKEYVGVFSDITQRKNDEEKILYQANYDALTGLPNRTLLADRIEHALSGARREKWQVALLFIDLDHFKNVNDTMGHVVGDSLLQQAAQRMRACLREADTLARFGGDEFVILLDDVRQADDAAEVASKVISTLSRSFSLGGRDLYIGASIGVALFPEDAQDAEQLLRNADMAMYGAKEGGRNNYQFFTATMNQQVHQRLELECNLRQALERQELSLHYQPVVDVVSGRVTSLEALLRWQHPQQGAVPPSLFIPLAEETGLILPIGLWVLQQACAQAVRWQQQGIELGVSVNVSSRQLPSGLPVQQIESVLRESGLAPERLKLEITESLMLQPGAALEWIDGVRALGVGIALDDFGTGYSSLNYLKRYRVDTLKIDRSFVSALSGHPQQDSLVRTMLAMADSLGLSAIAEGVETAEQLAALQKMGCRTIQGFLFSRPLAAEEIPHAIEQIEQGLAG